MSGGGGGNLPPVGSLPGVITTAEDVHRSMCGGPGVVRLPNTLSTFRDDHERPLVSLWLRRPSLLDSNERPTNFGTMRWLVGEHPMDVGIDRLTARYLQMCQFGPELGRAADDKPIIVGFNVYGPVARVPLDDFLRHEREQMDRERASASTTTGDKRSVGERAPVESGTKRGARQ